MATYDSSGGTRVCISCDQEKALAAFRDNRRKCKRCTHWQAMSPEQKARKATRKRERMASETPEERTRRLAVLKAYADKNRASLLEDKRRYYAENRDRVRQEQKERYASDLVFREAALARARESRAKFPGLKAAYNKAWAEANKERMAEYFRTSKAKRRQNPTHRLNDSISTQIRIAIGDQKQGRRWERLVGYALADLVAHLERQFLPGMSWENYGVAWHIDHIVARAEFELGDADEATIRACWALPNLRPLWSKQNMSKGKRRTHLL